MNEFFISFNTWFSETNFSWILLHFSCLLILFKPNSRSKWKNIVDFAFRGRFSSYVFSRFFHVFHSATNSTIKIRNNKTRTKQWQQKNSCINSFHCSALTAFFVSLSFSLTQMVFATAAFILILYSFKFFRPLEIGYVFMFSCERCFCVALCLLFRCRLFSTCFIFCLVLFSSFVHAFFLCTRHCALLLFHYIITCICIYLYIFTWWWKVSFEIRLEFVLELGWRLLRLQILQKINKVFVNDERHNGWVFEWNCFFVCRCSVICKFVLRCLMQPSIVQYSSVHANPGDINSRHIIRKISAQRQPHISNRRKHLSVASPFHLVFFVFLRFAVCDVFDDNSADDDNDNGRERWFRVNRNVIKLFHSFFSLTLRL